MKNDMFIDCTEPNMEVVTKIDLGKSVRVIGDAIRNLGQGAEKAGMGNSGGIGAGAAVGGIPAEMDGYGGIIIKDMDLLADTEQEFDAQLAASIESWKTEGARSIQIFFKPPKCHLMNVAAKRGFYFHHANR